MTTPDNTTHPFPPITLRIPGAWTDPRQLVSRLPEGYRLTPEALFLPDGTEIEFVPMPPDDQFPQIFQSSCRMPATQDELERVARYSVNIGLNGPGGSREAALTMMQAGATIVRAGGVGVFIDNCALAHGGGAWLEMADDGGVDALSFAFVSIIRSGDEVYTVGMQTMGLPDLLMRREDCEQHDEAIVEMIRYICRGEKPIDVGHLLADDQRPRYQVVGTADDTSPPSSPMHNPRGRLKIGNYQQIIEGN